jgi:hypothetical protein
MLDEPKLAVEADGAEMGFAISAPGLLAVDNLFQCLGAGIMPEAG